MEVAAPRALRHVATHIIGARALAALLLALFLALFAAPAPAQQPAPVQDPQLTDALDRPGDLVLRETSLQQALLTIGQEWHVNIVFGREIDGLVNASFQDTPLREILDSVLMANGYGYRTVGRSLVIVSLDSLGNTHHMFHSDTITLSNLNAADIAPSAALLSSESGKVEAIPSARSLLVIDHPERVEAIRRFVERVDGSAGGGVVQGGQVEVAYFTPQFVEAADLLESVNSVLSVNGRVTVVESENRLVVVDCPQCLQMAQQVVAQLDIPRPQVRITALIYDISLQDMERIGINWGSSVRNVNSDGETTFDWAIDSLMAIPTGSTVPGATMTIANMTQNFDLSAVVHFLRTCDDSRLLADPTVIVTDREPASIQIVTEIPIQQLTETDQGGALTSTAFRDAGVTLTVEPHISYDRTILMDVTPIFSRLAGFTEGDTPQPIIDKREANTTVRVRDGNTFVLGGLRQRQEVGDFRRVPVLGDIQVADVGALFRYRERSVRESELVVFIRPQILDCDYSGTMREQMAIHASDSLLSRVPAATDDPCAFGCQSCGPGGQYPIYEPTSSDELYMGLPYGQQGRVPEVHVEEIPPRQELPLPDGAYYQPQQGSQTIPQARSGEQLASRVQRMPGVYAPAGATPPPPATPVIDSLLRDATAPQVAAAPQYAPAPQPHEAPPQREPMVAQETWVRQLIEFR